MKKIVRTLKKYFIPHEENDHRPHILRREIIILVCLVLIVGEIAFVLGTSLVRRSSLFGTVVVSALTDETNFQRMESSLSELHVNSLLQVAAQAKADDMAAKSYFSHTSPDGVTPWYWFKRAGYTFSYAGENLAINFSDSQDVTNAWMNSPEHRANILNTNFTEIGMATAQGTYNGSPAIYIVELFGTPAFSPVATNSSSDKKSSDIIPTPIIQSVPSSSVPVVNVKEGAVAGTFQKSVVAEKDVQPGNAPPVVTVPSAQTSSDVVTSVGKQTTENNSIQNAVANPRQTVNYFYLVLISIFAMALVLNIFIKIKIQHPDLILGGVMILAMAGIFIIFNQQLFIGFIS